MSWTTKIEKCTKRELLLSQHGERGTCVISRKGLQRNQRHHIDSAWGVPEFCEGAAWLEQSARLEVSDISFTDTS